MKKILPHLLLACMLAFSGCCDDDCSDCAPKGFSVAGKWIITDLDITLAGVYPAEFESDVEDALNEIFDTYKDNVVILNNDVFKTVDLLYPNDSKYRATEYLYEYGKLGFVILYYGDYYGSGYEYKISYDLTIVNNNKVILKGDLSPVLNTYFLQWFGYDQYGIPYKSITRADVKITAERQ